LVLDVGPISIVDPTSDASLMNGYNLTQNATALADATIGRHVIGVAADGVSQLLIRVPGNPTDTLSAAVLSGTCAVPESCSPSESISNDGGIRSALSSTAFGSATNIGPAFVNGSSIFLLSYLAPANFARDTSDVNIGQRDLWLSLSFNGGAPSFQKISIVRSPIALIHGTFSDPSVWGAFRNALPSAYKTYLLDYSEDVEDLDPFVTTIPSYLPQRGIHHIQANVLGIDYNAPQLLTEVAQDLEMFRQDPDIGPVAAARVDVVGHSLGGLMARGMVKLSAYRDPSNFGRGYFNRIVTLGTPHLGTDQASRMLDGNNTCVRNFAAASGGYAIDTIQFLNSRSYYGAIHDQSGGVGYLLSDTLQNLSSSSLPSSSRPVIAYVAAHFGPFNFSPNIGSATLRFLCRNNVLAQWATYDNWDLIFSHAENDAVVPVWSALNGTSSGSGPQYTLLQNVVHGPGTIGFGTPLDPHLGFAGFQLLDAQSSTPFLVVNLLNTPIIDPKFVPLP
jgi:pimeloyl-ACP methyl ester carboxylesterase